MRQITRWIAFFAGALGLALGACDPMSHEPADAEVDAHADGARMPAPPPCPAPIEGDSPFGFHTEYTGPFYGLYRDSVLPSWLVEADVWFPEGRRAGAPILLSAVSSRGLELDQATLDPELGSEWISVLTSLHGRVGGALVGPSDGLFGEAYLANPTTSFTDVLDEHSATARFCANGAPSEPRMRPMRAIGPLSTIELALTAPVVPETVSVTVGGEAVAATSELRYSLLVRPDSALPPGQPVTLDLGAATDPIGRGFALDTPLVALTTTAAMTRFDPLEMPEAGTYAFAGTGAVTVTPDGLSVGAGSDHAFVLALEAPAGSSIMRIDAAATCSTGLESPRLGIVHADGTAVMWPDACMRSTVETAVASGETVWLALDAEPPRPLVPSTAGPAPPTIGLLLRSVTFE